MSIVSEWSHPPAELCLEDQNVHVWRAFLDCEGHVLQRLEASLAPDEISRAARFVFPRDRDHFIVARGILRSILGAYINRPASEIELIYGPAGKPAIQMSGGKPSIRFNLSHSHGLVVYAFSTWREIGIDVEAIRPDVAVEEIADRFFSARERAELQSLPQELRNEGFFLCWTCKEAYIKARGSGMGISLNSFGVSVTPGHPRELRSSDSSQWSLRSLQAAPGYVGAVVGEGRDWGLRLWDWEKKRPATGT